MGTDSPERGWVESVRNLNTPPVRNEWQIDDVPLPVRIEGVRVGDSRLPSQFQDGDFSFELTGRMCNPVLLSLTDAHPGQTNIKA
jgi:hypothetical protein